jgi:hypothetical protein
MKMVMVDGILRGVDQIVATLFDDGFGLVVRVGCFVMRPTMFSFQVSLEFPYMYSSTL